MNLSNVNVPRGEQKLIAAIIGLALEDASSKPKKGIPTQDVSTALEFLFVPGPLDTYMSLLDMDVERFRQSLLDAMYADPVAACGRLNDFQVRCMRMNYEYLNAVKSVEVVA